MEDNGKAGSEDLMDMGRMVWAKMGWGCVEFISGWLGERGGGGSVKGLRGALGEKGCGTSCTP